MRFAPLLIGAAVAAVLLAGCAPDEPSVTESPVAQEPSETPSPTPESPIADDPAAFPIDGPPGFAGVQFTLADDQLQCAIFDPAGADLGAPHFGCVVNVVGYPYPPVDEGPSDTANAFVSSGHGAGVITNVTDATFSGDDTAAALDAGHALTWSTVTCEALAVDEVRCTDAQSGHGVRVSIRDYELF